MLATTRADTGWGFRGWSRRFPKWQIVVHVGMPSSTCKRKSCYQIANRCKGKAGVRGHSPVVFHTGKESIGKMMINGVLGASF